MMEKDIFDKIHQIDYNDLTPKEKLEYKELFSSEEEFDNLKMFLSKVDDNKMVFEAPTQAKERLDELFVETYPLKKQKKIIPFYRKPFFQIAATVLLLISVIPLARNWNKIDRKEIAKLDEEVQQKEVQPKQKKEQETKIVESSEKNKVITFDEKENNELIKEIEQPIIAFIKKAILNDRDVQQDEILTDTTTDFGPFDSDRTGHPDGDYISTITLAEPTNISIPVSNKNEEIFDLITAAF